MVARPARPCLTVGCPKLTRNGSRCPEHTQQHTRQRDQRRGSPAERGYDAAWRRLSRAAILAQPWCSRCYATADLTADHIVPLAAGGLSVIENVQVLCRTCNGRKAGR